MKKLILLILCALSFTSCKYFRGDHCNNTKPIIGVYKNIYDKNAENILIIKKDSTFKQVFKKGITFKTNNGTWKKNKEFPCEIDLNGLKILHELSDSNLRYFTQNGIHRLNNIVFVEGLSYEFDFYRVTD